MITRYSREEMSGIWTDEAKYSNWLKVEIAVCEAWCELGEIPKKSLITLVSSIFVIPPLFLYPKPNLLKERSESLLL